MSDKSGGQCKARNGFSICKLDYGHDGDHDFRDVPGEGDA